MTITVIIISMGQDSWQLLPFLHLYWFTNRTIEHWMIDKLWIFLICFVLSLISRSRNLTRAVILFVDHFLLDAEKRKKYGHMIDGCDRCGDWIHKRFDIPKREKFQMYCG